jgi:hypothetical protein
MSLSSLSSALGGWPKEFLRQVTNDSDAQSLSGTGEIISKLNSALPSTAWNTSAAPRLRLGEPISRPMILGALLNLRAAALPPSSGPANSDAAMIG